MTMKKLTRTQEYWLSKLSAMLEDYCGYMAGEFETDLTMFIQQGDFVDGRVVSALRSAGYVEDYKEDERSTLVYQRITRKGAEAIGSNLFGSPVEIVNVNGYYLKWDFTPADAEKSAQPDTGRAALEPASVEVVDDNPYPPCTPGALADDTIASYEHTIAALQAQLTEAQAALKEARDSLLDIRDIAAPWKDKVDRVGFQFSRIYTHAEYGLRHSEGVAKAMGMETAK